MTPGSEERWSSRVRKSQASEAALNSLLGWKSCTLGIKDLPEPEEGEETKIIFGEFFIYVLLSEMCFWNEAVEIVSYMLS